MCIRDRYKYVSTILGGAISGLGGLYFVMEYLGGTWTNNGFGNRGWLAIALVIFSLWKPINAILGSILFGGLYVAVSYTHLRYKKVFRGNSRRNGFNRGNRKRRDRY